MTISNTQDVIDSRDVIARIEELQDQQGRCDECAESTADLAWYIDEEGDTVILCPSCEHDAERSGWHGIPTEPESSLDEDDAAELVALLALADEAEDVAADWTYGAALIHEDYFEDYARQLAEDIGAIDPDAGWPLAHIDWEAAAEALKIDYSEVDFDGATYWVRS